MILYISPLPRLSLLKLILYTQGEECCAWAYGGQLSQACVCEHLDTPKLGCPGIIEFERTIVETVVTTTISLGDLVVPADPVEKDNLVSDLEETIKALLVATMGSDVVVRIISIGGVAVRRLLRNHPNARLLSASAIETEIRVTREKVDDDQGSKNSESTTDSDAAAADVAGKIAAEVVSQVTAATSDPATVQAAIQRSDNAALASVTVEEISTDENPVTTSSTQTVVGVSCFVSYYDTSSLLSYTNSTYLHSHHS